MHFVIFSFGLMKFTQELAWLTNKLFDFSSLIALLCDWMKGGGNPGKLQILLQYVYSLIGFFVFSGIFLMVIYLGKESPILHKFFHQKRNVIFYVVMIIAVNIFLICEHNYFFNILASCFWLLGLSVIPYLFLQQPIYAILKKLHDKIAFSKTIYRLITLVFIGLFF